MRPLAALDAPTARALEGLVTDLDDTVLDHGRLSLAAYAALCAAAEAGFPVLVATGRPLGWADVVARTWPVIGAVAENGAAAARREGARVERWFRADEATRAARATRLAALVAAVRAAFPEIALADDNPLRATDATFDVGETCRVPAARVRELAQFARARGARTTASSVHVHVTFEEDDKASGALWFLRRARGLDATRARATWAFAGDSGNDASCFGAFRMTFGVANVAAHLGALSLPPRFVADAPMGEGFARILTRILELRR